MFGLFKKKRQEPVLDFSAIGTDMHSHILPGIDDGAPNLEAALVLAKKFVDLGFKKLVATPHVMADYFRNTPATIQKSLETLQEAIAANNIPLEISASAEYYLDETFVNKLDKKEVISFGNNYLLFELSYINMPSNVLDVVYRIQECGYYPVLAHPERYPYYHGSIENYLQLKEKGCLLQLNTISLTGYYGSGVKKAAEQLLENHAIDFLGSDMHHPRHAAALRDSLYLPNVQNLLLQSQLSNLLL